MLFSTLLHFYQPHNQQDDILLRIVRESYEPILLGILNASSAKVTVNFPGVLTKLLVDRGHSSVIDMINQCAAEGKIEFVSSAMYHAILPLLPEDEIRRQITANDEINLQYFGDVYSPVGFFPPEMAVDPSLFKILLSLGYSWVAAPQVSYGSERPDYSCTYSEESSGLAVMFRNKSASYLMLSAMAKNADELSEELRDFTNDSYLFTVMDAETFGHHRIGHERLLDSIWTSDKFECITTCELLSRIPASKKVEIRPSTWTNEEQDFWLDDNQTKSTSNKSYILWKDPSNPIHELQWQLTELAIDEVHNFEQKGVKEWENARQKLDKAVASDQYWWASAKPWWSLEMIEQGAFALREVVFTLYPSASDIKPSPRSHADELYRKILDKAFEWQRTGYIRKMHTQNSSTYLGKPFKDRTPKEWFNQVVLEFEYEMNKASAAHNFEKAIKWRDALTKIALKTDIHDVLHVVDDLWLGRNVPWAEPQVKPFLEHDWDEFSDFAKKHFLDVKNKEDFEKWKKKNANIKE